MTSHTGTICDVTLCLSRQELEEFEERTREETQKLVSMVTELQAENRRMHERREAERNGDTADQTGMPRRGEAGGGMCVQVCVCVMCMYVRASIYDR